MGNVYTSNFASWRKYPKGALRVSIATSMPPGTAVEFHLWNAKPDYEKMVRPFKDGEISEEEYKNRYFGMLDAAKDELVTDVTNILSASHGRDVVLLCWCSKGQFCHRHLLAAWLKDMMGLEVNEL